MKELISNYDFNVCTSAILMMALGLVSALLIGRLVYVEIAAWWWRKKHEKLMADKNEVIKEMSEMLDKVFTNMKSYNMLLDEKPKWMSERAEYTSKVTDLNAQIQLLQEERTGMENNISSWKESACHWKEEVVKEQAATAWATKRADTLQAKLNEANRRLKAYGMDKDEPGEIKEIYAGLELICTKDYVVDAECSYKHGNNYIVEKDNGATMLFIVCDNQHRVYWGTSAHLETLNNHFKLKTN